MRYGILCAGAVAALSGAAQGQLAIGNPPMMNNGLTYSQNFNSLQNLLPNPGTGYAWANNTTLPGWFAYHSRPDARNSSGIPIFGTPVSPGRDTGTYASRNASGYFADFGSATSAGLYSEGSGSAIDDPSTNSTERALGSIASAASDIGGDQTMSLVLQNTGMTTYDTLLISYQGEQWRVGGGHNDMQSLVFDRKVSATFTVDMLYGGNVAGYTADPLLDFTGPQTGIFSTSLDGNLPANSDDLESGVLAGLDFGPGEFLILRWWDDNDVGNDHTLALDDMKVELYIPTPGSAALIGLAGLLGLRRRRA